jgi:hypothetical protein
MLSTEERIEAGLWRASKGVKNHKGLKNKFNKYLEKIEGGNKDGKKSTN